jgi:hypothetical protein
MVGLRQSTRAIDPSIRRVARESNPRARRIPPVILSPRVASHRLAVTTHDLSRTPLVS